MKISKHILEVYEVFSRDEALLRFLYYPSENLNDDPLDRNKQNILDREDKLEIIHDVIKFTPNTDSLDDGKKCRICFYAGRRRNDRTNEYSKNQEVIFDILVHRSFHEADLRMYKIAERVNDLVLKKRYSSFGKVRELDSEPIGQVAKDYFGYKTSYLFGELDDR